jgi:hypothetical protein
MVYEPITDYGLFGNSGEWKCVALLNVDMD